MNAAAARTVTVAPDPAAPAPSLDRWWTAFGDPVLDELVDRALDANTDLEVAAARVRQARASLRGAQAGYWPTLGAGLAASTRESAPTLFDASLDASYEVDLFGGVRRSVTASRADLAATEASREGVRTTVAAEVALAYFDLRLAQRRLEIARANLASQDETLQIVEWRVLAGLVDGLDQEQARRLRAQTAAAVPLVEQSLVAAENRLAVLLDRPASALRADTALQTAGVVPLASLPAVGVPAETLRRRPDVIAAEQSLVAEIARVGVREADLYPALRLSGSLGGSGSSVGDAVSDPVAALVASLAAPLFEGGRRRAALESQRAAADAALASYRGVVLAAVAETENALIAVDAAARREAELIVAEVAARNAAQIARGQYQAGLIDFQTLLDAERSLLTTEDSRAAARADRATATVRLFKALGGGWDAPTAAP